MSYEEDLRDLLAAMREASRPLLSGAERERRKPPANHDVVADDGWRSGEQHSAGIRV